MHILHVTAGLLILIIVNIVLGCTKACFEKCFVFSKLWHGIIKGVIVLLCLSAVYFAGYLNPDVIAINIGGQSYTLMEAICLIIFGGYLSYAYQVIHKLSKLLTGKMDIVELDTGTKEDTE